MSCSNQDVRDELHTLLFSEADARTLRQELTTSSLNAQDQRKGPGIWFNSVNLMQKHAWLGRMSSPYLRGICWRICFDIFNNNSKVSFTKPGRSLPVDASLYDIWAQEIIEGKKDYEAMLKEAMPDAANISEDPLSSLSQSNEQSEGWRAYYKKVELANFIKVDLDRLYLQGLEDDIARNEGKSKAASENDDEEEISFFFVHPIPERLLNILMLFSMKNDKVSYRQGMHEICGIVYYVLYTEAKHWSNLGSGIGSPHPLQAVFRDEYLESQVYFLFSQVMKGLLPLYDPTPRNKGFSESVPAIVDYCTRIQEHFLLQVDADLCNHLQDCYIQGQIYGMRWSRLLLSREFPVTHDFSLKIWDFLFVTCMELSPPEKMPSSSTSPVVLVLDGTLAPNNSTLLVDETIPGSIDPLINFSHAAADPLSSDLLNTPTRSSVNATLSSSPTKMSSNLNDFMISELPSAQASMSSQTKALRERYGDYSTLMGVLGDFILAMLLNIRDDLMKGDSNEVLGLLMRYPKVTSVTPIMDLADMLRRGVLTAEAHISSPQKNDIGSGFGSSFATKKYANAGLSSKPGGFGNTATSTPAWLLASVANSIPAINNTAMNMSRKVSENIYAAVSYVKSKGGSNDSPSPSLAPAPASPIPSSNNSNNSNNVEKNVTTGPTPATATAIGSSSFTSNANFDPLLGIDIETSGGSSSSNTSVKSPSVGNSGLRRLNNFFSSSKVKEKERTKEMDPGYSMNTFSDSSGGAIGSGLFGSTSSSSSPNSMLSSSKPSGPPPSEQVSQRLQAIADILDSALVDNFSTHSHTTGTYTTDSREKDGELSARLRYLSSILQNKATAKDYDAQFPANSFNTSSNPSSCTSPSCTSPSIQTDTAKNSDEYIVDVVDTIT